MHRHLNHNGLKDSAGMWRTVAGLRWPQWSVEQYQGQAEALRAAGVRVKRIGEELFVHPDDVDKADALAEAAGSR